MKREVDRYKRICFNRKKQIELAKQRETKQTSKKKKKNKK